jgi:PAS domain S-box-containing protein
MKSAAHRGAIGIEDWRSYETRSPPWGRLAARLFRREVRGPTPYSNRPASVRYGMAIVALGLAVASRLTLMPVAGDQFPFLTFFFALVFAAWFGGLGPALAGLGISLVTVPFLLEPAAALLNQGPQARIGFGLYGVTGLALCLMGGSMRQAQLRAEASEAAARGKQARLEEEISEKRRAEGENDRLLREQRLLRAAAEEQSAVLASLLEQAPIGITFFDSDLKVSRINAYNAALCGDETDRLVGRPLRDVLASYHGPGVPDEVEETFRDVLETGEPFGVRGWASELAGRPGQPCYSDWSLRRIEGPDGRPIGLLLISQDVTGHTLRERALEASEARFRNLADAIPQIVWISGPTGASVQYLNRRWFDYTGLPEDGMSYDPGSWASAVHPADLARVVEAAAASAKQGEPFEAEYRLRDREGTYRWFLGRAVPVSDGDGRVVCRFGTATDIDDRKRSEQAARFLAAASSALASLVDESTTLQQVALLAVPHFADWCVVDMAGSEGAPRRLAVANVDPAKVAIAHELNVRYPFVPEASSGVYRILRSGEPELVAEITDEMLVAGARDEEHLRIVRALGLRSYMGIPLPGRDGTIGVISFVSAESGRRYGPDDLRLAQDLACRAAIAIENARLYEELKEADRRKDEFLATLAHELRNPLAPIRNALRLMGAPGAGNQAANCAMAERQVAHLARLVDDLIDVARITRGTIELRKKAVELGRLVADVVETVGPAIEARGLSLEFSLPGSPVWLEADPTRLEQVLWNLLDNAIKYTEPGGRISIRARAREGEVALGVADTGIGIAPEVLPRVFAMFYQGARRSDRLNEGLGIGLGLIRKLVELHGGTIEARSEGPGRGSEFVVTLPALPAAAAVMASPAPAGATGPTTEARAASTGRRVLVVDDHIDAADSLASLLSILGGHEVEVAHDGRTALRIAREFRPELAILDLGMPVMDGYELARRLRDLDGPSPLKLVALSGWGQDGDRRKARDAGFDVHLVKPVDPSCLLKMLAEQGDGERRSGRPRPGGESEG